MVTDLIRVPLPSQLGSLGNAAVDQRVPRSPQQMLLLSSPQPNQQRRLLWTAQGNRHSKTVVEKPTIRNRPFAIGRAEEPLQVSVR